MQGSDVLLHLPYPIYSDSVGEFITRFYLCGAADTQYDETLKVYGLTMDHESIAMAIPSADEKLLRAILTCYFRQEQFCDGVIGTAIKNGNLASLLRRMKRLHVSRLLVCKHNVLVSHTRMEFATVFFGVSLSLIGVSFII